MARKISDLTTPVKFKESRAEFAERWQASKAALVSAFFARYPFADPRRLVLITERLGEDVTTFRIMYKKNIKLPPVRKERKKK